jgi:hypothetical protein
MDTITVLLLSLAALILLSLVYLAYITRKPIKGELDRLFV